MGSLVPDDVTRLGLEPNLSEKDDPRSRARADGGAGRDWAAWWREVSGGLDEQYELEAVDPPELRRMLDDALAETWSVPAHNALLAREREERDELVTRLTEALG
jgi:hypothetical protein